MMQFFFVTIPHLLFEPIAVFALLGIAAALLLACRKKHDGLYWIIAGAIFFMLAWRLISFPRMRSSRYSAVLLYPAVILTVWFSFQAKIIIQQVVAAVFPRLNGVLLRKICAFIPVLCVAGLFIACLAKTVRYNPYGKNILKICETIRHETAGKKFRLYAGFEPNRISYYSGVKRDDVRMFDPGPSLSEKLMSCLNHAENDPATRYFVFFLENGEPMPDAGSLHILPETGKWECLQSEYNSRRKNRKIVLCRFTPGCPNLEEWSGPLPDLPEDNLVRNGGFEDLLAGDKREKFLQNYVRKGYSSYADPSRMIPADWRFSLGRDPENPPDLRLTQENALAGAWSFCADTRSGKGAFSILSPPIKKPDRGFQFSFFVRNEGSSDSKIRVILSAWLPDEKKSCYVRDLILTLDAGKTYRIHGTVPEEQVPQNSNNIYFNISARGKYIFDQFRITAI